MRFRRRTFSTSFVYPLLALLLLGLDQLGLLAGVKIFFSRFTLPVKESIWGEYQTVNENWANRGQQATDWVMLRDKTEILEREKISLKAEVDRLRQENESMRKLLGATLPSQWQFLPAKIIGCKEEQCEIDQGERQGIREGAPVVVENILVGEIAQVGLVTAKVRLLTHADFSASVLLEGGKTKGTVRVRGSRLFLEEIALSESLQTGKIVVRQKDGLVVGTIGKILTEQQETTQRAELVWPIKPNELNNVFVVKLTE